MLVEVLRGVPAIREDGRGLNAAREATAYFIAGTAAVVSPWWRFRIWSRLAGADAYRDIAGKAAMWTRVKPHNFEVELSESDWMERYAIRSGYFYQDEVTALLQSCVSAGSAFVDIGANIGFVSLTASWLVGSTGHVFAFEPNRNLVQRLQRTISRNKIGNITTFQTAAGEVAGTVGLVMGKHHGTNRIAMGGDEVTEKTEVSICRADDLLRGKIADGIPLFVKIDVEGAEIGALNGLPEILNRPNTKCLVELGDAQSARFGTTAQHVFDIFERFGYDAYLPRLSPFSSKLKLKAIRGPLNCVTYDVFFSRK